jgi:hypothetical protein
MTLQLLIKKEALVICLLCRLPESMDASRFSFNFTELDNTQAIFIAEIFLSNVHSKRFNNKFLL